MAGHLMEVPASLSEGRDVIERRGASHVPPPQQEISKPGGRQRNGAGERLHRTTITRVALWIDGSTARPPLRYRPPAAAIGRPALRSAPPHPATIRSPRPDS